MSRERAQRPLGPTPLPSMRSSESRRNADAPAPFSDVPRGGDPLQLGLASGRCGTGSAGNPLAHSLLGHVRSRILLSELLRPSLGWWHWADDACRTRSRWCAAVSGTWEKDDSGRARRWRKALNRVGRSCRRRRPGRVGSSRWACRLTALQPLAAMITPRPGACA